MIGGVTPTAGGVVLTGGYDGDFLVFDAGSGAILYRFHTGAIIGGGVSTYRVGDRQYVAVATGSRGWVGETGSPTLVVFTLRK
jgi:alcohol dehydrogenase (cytochrome c)